MSNIEIKGFDEFKKAINRNPRKVLDETRIFLVRGLAKYKSCILNSPWRIGGTGGGAPVSNDPRYPRKYQRGKSGNLRDSHVTEISTLQGSIGPKAEYAKYVAYGTKYMESRPWLEYVKQNQDGAIQILYRQLLDNVVKDLAK